MWKHCTSISLGLGALALSLPAQGMAPMQAQPYSQPAQPSQSTQAGFSAPSNGSLESNTFLEMADRVFDPDSDSMDFENGNFEWKGKRFSLSNQRVFRARFERFLLDSPNEGDERYAQLMGDIMQRLEVNQDNSDEAIIETWQLLFRASDFESDGGNSTIVANQVFNAWRIRKEARGASMTIKEQQQLREYQQEVVANRARILKRLQGGTQISRSGDDGQAAATSSALDVGGLATEESFRAKDILETEARILALETQQAATGIQAKLQIQSQIVAFLQQRRFQHAVILSGFYQLLFKGTHQQLEVGKEDMRSFFFRAVISLSRSMPFRLFPMKRLTTCVREWMQ